MISVEEYKSYLADYLTRYHNVYDLKKFFHCLNPEHTDNNPSMMFTNKYNICKCFACGVSYDIFDVIGIDYELDNFKDQIKKFKELYLDNDLECIKYSTEVGNVKYDYTNYYNKCIKNIYKSTYLQDRGISYELIKKYNIGYDDCRNLIIFPINKNCYFARSTINQDKIKSKGKSDVWNKKYLIDSNSEDIIYVTEGIIDSLSLEMIDSNIKTISINGIGNINNLVNIIQKNNFKGNIVIAFDNDKAGINAQNKLKEELAKINVNSFSSSLCNGDYIDLNDALVSDKDLLERNYRYYNKALKIAINRKQTSKGDELNYG